ARTVLADRGRVRAQPAGAGAGVLPARGPQTPGRGASRRTSRAWGPPLAAGEPRNLATNLSRRGRTRPHHHGRTIMRMTRLLLLSLLAVMACGVPLRAPAAALGATAPSLPRVVRVPSGGDLQAALDAAQPGDFIEMPAGATFVGIEVTTSSADGLNLIHLESPAQTSVDQVPTDIVFYRCYIHGSASGNIRRGIVLNGARLAVIGSYLSDFHDRDADSQAIAGWNGPGPFTIIGNYLEAAGENVMFGGADPTVPGLVP